jgi:hypothetical protein
MVSAHDGNLEYVLPFLNITSEKCVTDEFNFRPVTGNCHEKPEFASSLIIELHKIDSTF